VISSAILGRYARSLAEVVFEENLEQAVTEDLKTYSEIFKAIPELADAFHSPAVPHAAKEKLLGELMTLHPVTPIASNFLRVLLQHSRIQHIAQIYRQYLSAVNVRKGIVSAKVSTTAPLSPEELKDLGDRLARFTGRHVTVESRTEEELLGGVVVQIGNTIFDGSVRARLLDMKKRLAES
jgi:F-type H+-transporting ATPase subunit delta